MSSPCVISTQLSAVRRRSPESKCAKSVEMKSYVLNTIVGIIISIIIIYIIIIIIIIIIMLGFSDFRGSSTPAPPSRRTLLWSPDMRA